MDNIASHNVVSLSPGVIGAVMTEAPELSILRINTSLRQECVCMGGRRRRRGYSKILRERGRAGEGGSTNALTHKDSKSLYCSIMDETSLHRY